MNVGIIFFSKSGNTKLIAERFLSELQNRNINAEMIEVTSPKIPGMLGGGRAAMKQKDMPISTDPMDMKKFDMFLFGMPIWAWKPAPYVKSYLKTVQNIRDKAAGVFFTCGGSIEKHPKAIDVLTEQLSEYNISVISHISLQMNKGSIVDGEDEITAFIDASVTP